MLTSSSSSLLPLSFAHSCPFDFLLDVAVYSCSCSRGGGRNSSSKVSLRGCCWGSGERERPPCLSTALFFFLSWARYFWWLDFETLMKFHRIKRGGKNSSGGKLKKERTDSTTEGRLKGPFFSANIMIRCQHYFFFSLQGIWKLSIFFFSCFSLCTWYVGRRSERKAKESSKSIFFFFSHSRIHRRLSLLLRRREKERKSLFLTCCFASFFFFSSHCFVFLRVLTITAFSSSSSSWQRLLYSSSSSSGSRRNGLVNFQRLLLL